MGQTGNATAFPSPLASLRWGHGKRVTRPATDDSGAYECTGLDAASHDQALAGLRRLNKASRAAEVMGRVVVEKMRQAGLRRVAMLDVACGGGDVPAAIAQQLSSLGITVELTLMDRSAEPPWHGQPCGGKLRWDQGSHGAG